MASQDLDKKCNHTGAAQCDITYWAEGCFYGVLEMDQLNLKVLASIFDARSHSILSVLANKRLTQFPSSSSYLSNNC